MEDFFIGSEVIYGIDIMMIFLSFFTSGTSLTKAN